MVIHNERNIQSLIYAIGDIHGCLDPLKDLLKEINPSAEDKLIFIGDYIDRGPNSRGVIDFLIALSVNKNCVFIRGNHEQMMMDYFADKPEGKIWSMNGMDATLESYGSIFSVPSYHLDFLEETIMFDEEDSYTLVHAGVRPGISMEEQSNKDLLWIRDDFIYSKKPLKDRIVIFGHTPMLSGPLFQKHKIGIDTGCVYGGKLSAVRLEDLKVFSIKNEI